MGIVDRYGWLPVAAQADEVVTSLVGSTRLVVTAPPGAGKSTLLPLALLERLEQGRIQGLEQGRIQRLEQGRIQGLEQGRIPGVGRGRILVLEPRRIAARQVAVRMAAMLGEKVGQTVGYRMRFETRTSPATRIEVVTEGIMERMLVKDPTLEGVAAVIFDEFHERSLTSDLSLALVLEAQQIIRPDLLLMVMSATIDAAWLSRRLDAKWIDCPGQMFGVEVIHGKDFDMRDCAVAVATAVSRAHREQTGDILAFLPGQGAISRCEELLRGALGDTLVLPLYGMLAPDLQRRAMLPDERGRRRVILATPIAETSLTIEGITTVVDSGLYRTPIFDPSSGLSRLTTVPITLDMAAQRAGRAGRLGPGTCYRLWSKAAELRMAESRQPEVLTADLAPMALQTSAWGESDPLELPWVTPPPAGHVASARTLLTQLEAVDASGCITGLGRRMAELPCHPRLSRMLMESGSLAPLACDIAALLEEKDPVTDDADVNIHTRVTLLRQARRSRPTGPWRRIADIAAQYCRMMGVRPDNGPVMAEDAGMLLAMAYPRRVAMRAGDGRFRTAGGEYVTISEADPLSREPLLAIAAMDSRIFLAAPLRESDAAAGAQWRDNVSWDSRSGRALARRELRLGVLTLGTRPADSDATRPLVIEAICRAAVKEGLTMFDFSDDVRRLQMRLATVGDWHPELAIPCSDDVALLADAPQWLPMYGPKATTLQDLRRIDLCEVLWGRLDYAVQREVERLAPTHIQLPCGRRARVDYRRGAEAPVVSARLQDCFGLLETPRVDDGRRPVLMELLSPGFKPVQLTQDLAGFWRTTYFDVRKELRGRYPKHRWPEDPLSAPPKAEGRGK